MSSGRAQRRPTNNKTLFDKVWERHLVVEETAEVPAVLYVDLHLIHEVTSPQAFSELRERGLKLRRPDRTLGTLDHSTPTLPADANGELPYYTADTRTQVETLRRNAAEFGVRLLDFGSGARGIVHVIGPELGATQPGMTIVCGDSHTSTHGAFGAIAFGIGTSEVGHVMASQCLLQRKPKRMAIEVEGELGKGVSAKDVILHLIGAIGVEGGTGYAIEYRGSAIRGLDMDGRMTLCNMSIEAGARCGMVAPDDTTFEYLKGRPLAPQGADWERAVADWRTLVTDADAAFDRVVEIAAADIRPSITWGTHPGMGAAIDASVPSDDSAQSNRAREYMGFAPGERLIGHKIDVVFVGSCTNGRISDLRSAAAVLRGRRIADGVRMLVVPGSDAVKRDAEAEGLHDIFRAAGAEWREPGCSMCIAMNGDLVAPGQTAVSTSNRNFEGRQGKGARTVLASPATAAASAVAGCIADARAF